MVDRRIRVPANKVAFLKSLLNEDDGKGPFRYQVDVLAFAASLAARRDKDGGVPFKEATKEPIRKDIFERQGYDTLINLLAVYNTGDSEVLADSDQMEDRRATIFEEYANAGLAILEGELRGMVDYVDHLVLLIGEEVAEEHLEGATQFDLSLIV